MTNELRGFFRRGYSRLSEEKLRMNGRELARLIREKEGLVKDILDDEVFKSLRELYPMKVDSKKLRTIGFILTFAPEGITTFPGLMVLASSAIADRFFSPLGLDDIKRELTALLKDLDHERYM